MLDARTRFTSRLVVRLHFAVVTLVPPPSQIREDFAGAEREKSELQQAEKQQSQDGLVLEADVGGVLGLIDDPVMSHLFVHPFQYRLKQRIDPLRVPLQDLRPR